MSDFKVQKYKISFRLHGAQPQIPLGELTAPPILLSWILGDLHLRGMGRGQEERRREGEERGGRGISTASVMS